MDNVAIAGLLFLLLANLPVSPGCQSAPEEHSQSPRDYSRSGREVDLVDVENYSEIKIPFRVATAVREKEDWIEILTRYADLKSNQDPSTEAAFHRLAGIDFETDMVLLASLGEVPCMLTEPVQLFQSASMVRDTLYVVLGPATERLNHGGSNDICATAIDYLVHAVTAERHDGAVAFVGPPGYVPDKRNLDDNSIEQ